MAFLPRRGRGEGLPGRRAGGPRPRGGAGPAARGGRRGGAQEALDGRGRRRGLRHRPRVRRRRGAPAVGRRRAAAAPGGRARGGLAVGALPRHPPAPDRLHHLLVSELTLIALPVFAEMVLPRRSYAFGWCFVPPVQVRRRAPRDTRCVCDAKIHAFFQTKIHAFLL